MLAGTRFGGLEVQVPVPYQCWPGAQFGVLEPLVSGPYQCWVGARFGGLESHIPVLVGKTQTGTTSDF